MTEETSPTAPSTSKPAAPWRQLAVTALVPLAVLLIHHVPLPIDTGALEPADAARIPGVFSLGLTPFISASLLVELVSLVVPAWSRLRSGGPEGRRLLGRAATILGALFALFQAFGMWKLLESLTGTSSSWSGPTMVASLVAGSCLLLMIAQRVSRRGLVNGVVAIWLLDVMVGEVRRVQRALTSMTPLELGALATGVALVVGFTWFALRPAARPTAVEGALGYRSAGAADGGQEDLPTPVPASGTTALGVAAGLLSLPALLVNLTGEGSGVARALTENNLYGEVGLGLALLASGLLSFAFNHPARLATLAARADSSRSWDEHEESARAGLRVAIQRTALYVGLLFAIGELLRRWTGQPLEIAAIALATALCLDTMAEWRARRASSDLQAVWPEHRPYAVAFARASLAKAKIEMFARSEGQRRLLQFWGPYVPIELMVASQDAERATKILAPILVTKPGDESVRASADKQPTPAIGARPIAAALILMGGALTLLHASPPAPRGHGLRSSIARPPATLELLLVDDDADPFAIVEELPSGVSIQLENRPLGPGRTGPRHVVRAMRAEGETLDQTLTRVRPRLAAVPLPAGDRLVFGHLTEYDDEKDRLEVIGWQTYVVQGPPVVTAREILGALARPSEPADGRGKPGAFVSLTLSTAAAARFEAFTGAHIKQRLAILVDDQVMSAPLIQTAIGGGHVSISMGAGDAEQQLTEARELARKLGGN